MKIDLGKKTVYFALVGLSLGKIYYFVLDPLSAIEECKVKLQH